MKIFPYLFFCFVFVVVPSGMIYAQQNTPVTVTVSKNKKTIDGKTYYLHIVKQGETLYSISKAYNVLQKDIVFSNPDAFEGIKIGQELKIPVTSDDQKGSQLESSKFIYHITEQGQTVFYLTQLYHVTTEELYKYNPELEHSPLQTGQVVTIPKSDQVEPSKPEVHYNIHTVARRETLFSIAKNYDVDLNKIFEVNPEIDPNDPKVKIGQQIKIPLPEGAPIGLPVEVSRADTIIIRQDLVNDSLPKKEVVPCVPTTQTNFRVAMLLPLFLAENNLATSPDTTTIVKGADGKLTYKNGEYWIYPQSMNALEFYEGALLALDSLKKKGFNAQVYIFDTANDTTKVAQILQNPVMSGVDLIIGPFYTNLVNQVAKFAQKNKIYYVSPIAINAESLKNNPYLLQVNSGEINTVGVMTDYIKKQGDVHVILIGNRREFDQTLYQAYSNRLKMAFADTSLTMMQLHTDSVVRPTRYLKENKKNIVIIPATDEAFVNIIVAQLNANIRKYDINLYGLSVWTRFTNLDLEYLHGMEFRYASAFFIDYNRPEVKRFLQQYRQFYNTEPTLTTIQSARMSSNNIYHFSFLGYDVAFFFASALRQNGKGFGYCIPTFRLPTLQSDFHFQEVDPAGGYMNTHINIYKYTKDYTVVQETID